MLTMHVPSTLMGPVVPISGMGNTKIGTPARASFYAGLGHLLVVLQGRIVQLVTE